MTAEEIAEGQRLIAIGVAHLLTAAKQVEGLEADLKRHTNDHIEVMHDLAAVLGNQLNERTLNVAKRVVAEVEVEVERLHRENLQARLIAKEATIQQWTEAIVHHDWHHEQDDSWRIFHLAAQLDWAISEREHVIQSIL